MSTSTSSIKQVIKSYVEIDNEIKVLSKQASVLKTQKKLLSEQIKNYIQQNSENPNAQIEIGSDVFKVVSYKKKVINKTNLENSIKDNIKDEETVRLILDDAVEEKEESYLKRTIKK